VDRKAFGHCQLLSHFVLPELHVPLMYTQAGPAPRHATAPFRKRVMVTLQPVSRPYGRWQLLDWFGRVCLQLTGLGAELCVYAGVSKALMALNIIR
jgi:hypothetical protein